MSKWPDVKAMDAGEIKLNRVIGGCHTKAQLVGAMKYLHFAVKQDVIPTNKALYWAGAITGIAHCIARESQATTMLHKAENCMPTSRFTEGPIGNGDFFEFPANGMGPARYHDNTGAPV